MEIKNKYPISKSVSSSHILVSSTSLYMINKAGDSKLLFFFFFYNYLPYIQERIVNFDS